MNKLRVLDLFSGLAGFSLGLERAGGFSTIAFCEIETRLHAHLSRHWPGVPVYADIHHLRGEPGCCEVVCGGFPCQPYSTASAGRAKGSQDDRALWPEMRRVISEARPHWVICENVRGIASFDLERVVSDLERIGFSVAPPLEVPACAVGLDHGRPRYWIVGHSDENRKSSSPEHGEAPRLRYCGPRPEGVGEAHGLSFWMGALGNAVVPQIPELIGRAIMEAEGMA